MLVHDLGKYEIVGETRDDAIGEAYDKVCRAVGVATLLNESMGAAVERVARTGNDRAIPLPVPMKKSKQAVSLDFSFSGLKTAVFSHIASCGGASQLTPVAQADIVASFQRAALSHLQGQTQKCLRWIAKRAPRCNTLVCSLSTSYLFFFFSSLPSYQLQSESCKNTCRKAETSVCVNNGVFRAPAGAVWRRGRQPGRARRPERRLRRAPLFFAVRAPATLH
jgi:hypothetical protein